MKRLDAARAGLVFYNSGNPCRRGHTTDRYVSTGQCVECMKRIGQEVKESRTKLREITTTVRGNSSSTHFVTAPQRYAYTIAAFERLLCSAGGDDLAFHIAMLDSPPLTRERLLQWYVMSPDGSKAVNWEDYGAERDASGDFYTMLDGHWYKSAEIFAVLQGRQASVSRLLGPFVPYAGEDAA